MAIHMGTIIRARRKELGMTQEELALKIGYKTKVAINKIEKGERKLPSDKINATAEALGISPNYLTSWNERGETSEPIVRDTRESQSRRMIAYWLQTAPPSQINAVATLIEALNKEN